MYSGYVIDYQELKKRRKNAVTSMDVLHDFPHSETK